MPGCFKQQQSEDSSSGVALRVEWLTWDIDALVVRNGGGAVGPQLQALLALDHFLGSLEDVFVIQHTGASLEKRTLHGDLLTWHRLRCVAHD